MSVDRVVDGNREAQEGKGTTATGLSALFELFRAVLDANVVAEAVD
jgi:hypothetical protein